MGSVGRVQWFLVEEPDEKTIQAMLHVEDTLLPEPHDIHWLVPMDGPTDPFGYGVHDG